MTEGQLERAAELIHSRMEIKEFLSTRNKQSAIIKKLAKSKFEFQRREAERMPTAGVIEITIVDEKRCDKVSEQPDTMAYWFLSRDIVEKALRAYLPKIETELSALGIKSPPKRRAKP